MEFCWHTGSPVEPTLDVQNVTRSQLSPIFAGSEFPLPAT